MDAIILAAGSSRRFGSNKLLHEIDEKQMYRHVLELLEALKQAGSLNEVVLVTQYPEIIKAVQAEHSSVRTVFNAEPDLGISHSIKLGLQEMAVCSPDSEGCLFSVADQPYIKKISIERLVCRWRTEGKGIAACACGGIIGNPVIFSGKYYADLSSLRGDRGGKKIVMQHLDDTLLLPVEEKELRDVDVPADEKPEDA